MPDGEGELILIYKKKEEVPKINIEHLDLKNSPYQVSQKMTFNKGKRVGGIIVENGREYFVEYSENGDELKRKRTFEGIRLMIVGNKDVGKTTLKRRIMGISNEQDNKKSKNNFLDIFIYIFLFILFQLSKNCKWKTNNHLI